MLSTLLVIATAGAQALPVEIKLSPSRQFQTIEGFGTCLISWDGKMAKWYRSPLAAKTYAETLGFNILRVNLWGEGTIGQKQTPSAIRAEDPEFARTDSRTPIFLDFAMRVKTLQPELKVIGTVWSPPAWMKMNHSLVDKSSGAIDGRTYQIERNGAKIVTDNRVSSENFPFVASWIAEMARYYARQGVPLYGVSPANEPQFTQGFESCVWNATDLSTIIAQTRQALDARKLAGIKLFGPETMTGFNWEGGPNVQYTSAIRSNIAASKALDIWATHGYADGVKGDVTTNSSAKFWSMISTDQKPYWVTEGGTGGHEWPMPVSESGIGPAIHNALVAGNASAFVPWQFAEDSRSEHNLMPLEGPNKKTHTVRHFSKFITPGSVRIGCEPAFGRLLTSAYQNGRRTTVILLNPQRSNVTAEIPLGAGVSALAVTTDAGRSGEEATITADRAGKARVIVPGPGIVTLVLTKKDSVIGGDSSF